MIEYGRDYPDPLADPATEVERRVRLTAAATIKPRPVRWLWENRLPVGELSVTPGRGGIGKSSFHAWMIARITTGTLPGVYFGTPSACIIAAAEDSWERTIVPRLIATGADLTLVFRADVVTEIGDEVALTLPRDIKALAAEIVRVPAVLLSLDPLMSVVNGSLDTHKDRDVRQALEPLVRLANGTGCAVLGNAHFNKSHGGDPLALIMGSAAFGNVARAALGFARDMDAEDGSCVISQVKNNLGRMDLPSLRYVIESATIETDEGPADVGRLVMQGVSDKTVTDILSDRHDDGLGRSEVTEASRWLMDYLTEEGGEATANDVKNAGRASGFAERTLERARVKAGVATGRNGFGKGAVYVWRHPAWSPHARHARQSPKHGEHGEHGVVEPLSRPSRGDV